MIMTLVLAACMNSRRPSPPQPDPDAARAKIMRLIPTQVSNAIGWAVDIFASLDALQLAPTTEHICAVLAVIEQESNYQVDPAVPGLSALARKEVEARATKYGIPHLALDAALDLSSPNGVSYNQRLSRVRTEKDLSDLYEDFIGSVPLGKRLFAEWNPIRTAGPMQVSIAYAEQEMRARRYPYTREGSVRDELFSRRGGLYFGVAHLLYYPAEYDAMLYRFADFNAGHYASRNAAFQSALSSIARTPLTLDGDLLRHGDDGDQPSQTELALRKLTARLELSDAQIRRDLLREQADDFTSTALYGRLMRLADAAALRPVPRALVPRIRLQSPKISRHLTTDWYAHRVDQRYQQCLARNMSRNSGGAGTSGR